MTTPSQPRASVATNPLAFRSNIRLALCQLDCTESLSAEALDAIAYKMLAVFAEAHAVTAAELAELRAEVARLKAAAQPATDPPADFIAFWHAQSEWSQATFGTDQERGPVGALKHLAKEVQEALADPTDIIEFADLLFLVFDSTRRAGFTPEQLLDAANRKLEINKQRQWQKPTSDDPVEHVRATDPPAVRCFADASLPGFWVFTADGDCTYFRSGFHQSDRLLSDCEIDPDSRELTPTAARAMLTTDEQRAKFDELTTPTSGPAAKG